MNKTEASRAAVELTKALLQSNTNTIISKKKPETFIEQVNLIADFIVYLSDRLEKNVETDSAQGVQIHILDQAD